MGRCCCCRLILRRGFLRHRSILNQVFDLVPGSRGWFKVSEEFTEVFGQGHPVFLRVQFVPVPAPEHQIGVGVLVKHPLPAHQVEPLPHVHGMVAGVVVGVHGSG